MKLIIDIPEEVVEAIRNGGDYWYDIYTAIAQGKPFFPFSEDVFYKITDAEWEHSDSFWVTTPSGKKIEFEKKRPQGEWIITREKQGAFGIIYKMKKCNRCYWESSLLIPRNFCPNCGAEMKGCIENEKASV